MPTLWLVLLGILLSGYLALEGCHFGIGLLLPAFGRSDPLGARRDELVRVIAPRFLAGEVWLVAAAGTLLGAFPRLESALLPALYPVFVLILTSWLLRDAGLWLRRQGGAAWRTGWDRVIVLASAGLAAGWGLVLGTVLVGVPAPGSWAVFGPVPLLGGGLAVLLCAAHGSAALGVRRTGRLGLAIGLVTLALGAVAAPSAQPSVPWADWLLGLILLAAALGCRWSPGRRLAATSTALVTAVPLLVLSHFPVLPTGLAVPAAMADGATRALLTAFTLPALPVLLAAQLWLWWLSRQPRAWSFF